MIHSSIVNSLLFICMITASPLFLRRKQPLSNSLILNICNNSIDVMGEKMTGDGGSETGDGYEPKLTIRTHQTEKSVTVEIEDNGPGISEVMKDKILQLFFTTKIGTDGTGLWLSITNDIIKAHGGEIFIESAENAGTTFVIKMPNDIKTPTGYG